MNKSSESEGEEAESLLSEHEQIEHIDRIMEAQIEHQKIRTYKTIYTFTTAVGIGLLITTLYWLLHFRGGFAWQSDTKHEFNWHPFLMLFGMIFLNSQSILIYRSGRNMEKKKLKLFHAIFHFATFTFSVIGLKAVFDSHNLAEPPIANLYTIHSWIGLITVITFSLQFVVGFVTFLYPGLSTTLRKLLLPIHVVFGTSIFVMGLISALTGLTEKALWTLGTSYANFTAEALVVNFIGIVLVIYGLLVLYLVNDAGYKREPQIQDEVTLSMNE